MTFILGNQSLRHRIDKCTLNNPLNYNSLNDTSKPEESTFNKKKRKLEEAQTSTPKQAKVDKPKKPAEPQMRMNEILTGVRIALSGFVNPERGRIRDQVTGVKILVKYVFST